MLQSSWHMSICRYMGQPTTKSTTQPTTRSTTQPTTRSTMLPTTRYTTLLMIKYTMLPMTKYITLPTTRSTIRYSTAAILTSASVSSSSLHDLLYKYWVTSSTCGGCSRNSMHYWRHPQEVQCTIGDFMSCVLWVAEHLPHDLLLWPICSRLRDLMDLPMELQWKLSNYRSTSYMQCSESILRAKQSPLALGCAKIQWHDPCLHIPISFFNFADLWTRNWPEIVGITKPLDIKVQHLLKRVSGNSNRGVPRSLELHRCQERPCHIVFIQVLFISLHTPLQCTLVPAYMVD